MSEKMSFYLNLSVSQDDSAAGKNIEDLNNKNQVSDIEKARQASQDKNKLSDKDNNASSDTNQPKQQQEVDEEVERDQQQ